MGEYHIVEGPQVNFLPRVVLLMGIEIHPGGLLARGQAGVFVPTLIVMMSLMRPIRT